MAEEARSVRKKTPKKPKPIPGYSQAVLAVLVKLDNFRLVGEIAAIIGCDARKLAPILNGLRKRGLVLSRAKDGGTVWKINEEGRKAVES